MEMELNESVSKADSKKYLNKTKVQLKLTAINDDCKEMIFLYLEWSDMISVADTNDQLYSAICRAFQSKYGNSKIDFGLPCEDSFAMKKRTKLICPDIFVRRKLDALKILRNFGHLMANLYLNWDGFEFRDEPILERYLDEYTSGSLTHLSIGEGSITSFRFAEIQKPFKKLKSLNIEYCKVGSDVPFNRIFPCLQSLKLGCNVYENSSVIKLHFNELIALSISVNVHISHNKRLRYDDVIGSLELNPQLEKFFICNVLYEPQFFSWLTTNCLNLKSLGFEVPLWSNRKCEPKHFALVEELILHNVDELSTSFMSNFTFSNLKNLTMRAPNLIRSEITAADISKFISINPGVTSLTLQLYGIDDLAGIFKIENLLLNIEELIIVLLEHYIPSVDLFNFLSRNHTIKRFSLTALSEDFFQVQNVITSRYPEFKNYVLRVVTNGYEEECPTSPTDLDCVFEICSFVESTHLLSHKYNEYKNGVEDLLEAKHIIPQFYMKPFYYA